MNFIVKKIKTLKSSLEIYGNYSGNIKLTFKLGEVGKLKNLPGLFTDLNL